MPGQRVSLPTPVVGGLLDWLNPEHLINALGPWFLVGIFFIIFFEVSVPFGVLFPGDSLLFTLGLLASVGKIDEPLWLICLVIALAADLGGHLGYALGRRAGPALLHRPNSRFLKPEYVRKSHEFFERHGGRALVLARFVAVVRTFSSSFAGISQMNYRKFAFYNLVGSLLWCVGLPTLGYLLGHIPFVRQHFELIFLAVVAVAGLLIWREIRQNAKETAALSARDAAGPTQEKDA